MAILVLNLVAPKICTRHLIHYSVTHREKHIWDKSFNFIGFKKNSFYGNLKTYTEVEWIILTNPTYLLTELQQLSVFCQTLQYVKHNKESNFMFLEHVLQVDMLVYSKEKYVCQNVNSSYTVNLTVVIIF